MIDSGVGSSILAGWQLAQQCLVRRRQTHSLYHKAWDGKQDGLGLSAAGAGGSHFGLFTGMSSGKEYLVAVSGAENHLLLPKLSPIQEFGGGHLDGYFCVINMSGK